MFSNQPGQTAFGLKLRDLMILAIGLLLGIGILAADFASIYIRVIVGAGVILSALVLALWKESGSGDSVEQVLLKRFLHRTNPRRLVRGGSQTTSMEGLPAGRLTRGEPPGGVSAVDPHGDSGPDAGGNGDQHEPGTLLYTPIFYVHAPIKNEGLITFAAACFVMIVLLVAIWRYDLFESAIASLRLIGG
jgi:hypothetical protein